MPQYAYFQNDGSNNGVVIGWYDTDANTYSSLPAAADLLAVTAAQWTAHLSNPGGYQVVAGALQSYTPPPPTLTAAQQSLAAYNSFISGGLNVTFTSTPALTGTYAIDPVSQANIVAENVYVQQYATFTNGTTTSLIWPLANNTTVTFPSITEWNNFAKAVAQQVAAAKLALAQVSASMPTAYVTVS